MLTIAVILFPDFETLDVFGPVEIFGRLPQYFTLEFLSVDGGVVSSVHKVQTITERIREFKAENYILFIPGGIGTRPLVKDQRFISLLTELAKKAAYILTVCTGAILFSKTGMLDGKRATSNKRVFSWTSEESPKVEWIKRARWVKDGNIYTSSGVSAGMDMTLGFIADLCGYKVAKQQSNEIEYDWKENPEWDPFAELYTIMP
jgi:putative intracellular protease/amidase